MGTKLCDILYVYNINTTHVTLLHSLTYFIALICQRMRYLFTIRNNNLLTLVLFYNELRSVKSYKFFILLQVHIW